MTATRLLPALLLVPALALAGCTGAPSGADGASGGPGEGTSAAAPSVPMEVRLGVEAGAVVPVSTLVDAEVDGGELVRAELVGPDGPVPGEVLDAGVAWRAGDLLEPGAAYRFVVVARSGDGEEQRRTARFRTEDLPLERQTFPSIAPLEGETVGVGMPVVVQFDVPVTDRAEAERHLSVRSSPQQAGAWHWLSSTEVHWRPRAYWQAGSEVVVDADLNGVDVGGGVFGQLDRTIRFSVGRRLVHRVDVRRHEMRTFVAGRLVRTTEVSAGKPGFETRSGTKVVMEKFRTKRMDAATTGIAPGDPEYYDIPDVEYALRVTHSGEFLHAAPWSVGSQGSDNVSHGCVGMSTEDARWVFENTRRGDVVEVTGTERRMTLTNGFGDWNLPFAEYAAGSALS